MQYSDNFKHNEEMYQQLEDYLTDKEDEAIGDRALVVLGTGLGKTPTALEYLQRHNCRGLVLCPTTGIKNAWYKNNQLVDTITYQTFAKSYMKYDFTKYGVLICDEAHHLGAEKWGAPVRYLLNHHVIKVIGLTAHPHRMDGINVISEFFDNKVCYGLDVFEGIKCGILHPVSYVGAYYDASKESKALKKKYGEKLNEKLIGKLDLVINNTPKLKDILLKNMPEGKRKIIIFASDIEDIDNSESIIKNVYPDIEYRRLHSDMPHKEIEENRNWFENCEEGCICSVNMISEGIHYTGVNTIIMFRKTSSKTVFEQQIGRAITLAIKENPHAIIFDFVNNAKLVQNFKKKLMDAEERYMSGSGDSDFDTRKSRSIIIEDYTTEITKILNAIKSEMENDYEDWEIDILKQYYPTEGAQGCQKRIDKEWYRRQTELVTN